MTHRRRPTWLCAAALGVSALSAAFTPSASVASSAPMTSPSQAQTLAFSEGRLSYLKAGSGPAVVIVHGVGGHKEDWTGLIGALAGSHTVYAIDMIGFGGSSKDLPEIGMAVQAKAILALLDAEHIDRADLVGNSVGGWAAATFAANHPERVRRLALVDAAGFKAMFEGPTPVNFYPTKVEEMANLLAYVRFDPSTHTADYASKALEAFRASGDAPAEPAVFKGLFGSERLEDVGDRITSPTLVIWGQEDRLFPAAIADLVAGHVKGSAKVLIPAAGHFPQLDNPKAFEAAILGFLGQ